ncbi:hypothetical protein MY10362_007956 [Beauveria mimosiformis]
MRHNWQYLSLLLASEVVVAQRVLQGSVQHFQSKAAGPWQPLLSLGFGTPPQEIVGIFDTGSSDTIIPLAGSDLCQVKNQQCTSPAPIVRGQFDPEEASDVEELKGKEFEAGFSGGDEFNGEFIKTTISIGGDGGGEVPGAQVALASGGQPSGDFPQFSIFGTGPREAEATDDKYDNLPQTMKDAGVVKGNSYSVVMNPTPLANGSVFFGGIDRSKFSGELQKVAIDRDNSGKISDFVVKMTSLKLEMGGSSNKTAKLTKNQKRARRSLLRRGVRRRSIRERVGSKAKGTYGGGRVSTQSAEDEDDGEVNALNNGKSNGRNNDNCSCNNHNNNNNDDDNDEGDGNGGDNGNDNGDYDGDNNKNGNKKGNNNGNNKGNGNGYNNGNNNGNNNGDNNDNGDDNEHGNGNGNGNGNGGNGGDGNGKNNGKKNGGYQNGGNKNGGNKNGGNKNGGNATTPGLIDLGLKEEETFTLFDTGGVDLQLPAGVLRKMARALGTDFSEQDGVLGPVECGKLSADNKLVLGFNNDEVQATMALDKIRVSEEIADPELTRAGLCEVGAFAVDPESNLNSIGFVFFTDVYTVFDLETNSLWFAQAKGDPSAPGAQLEEFP